jgi:hypothetical protein
VALPVVGAALFAAAGAKVAPRAYDAGLLLAAQDDPARLADRYLDRNFTREVAEREIAAALAADDADLAQSFVRLAADRGIAVAPELIEKVNDANATAASGWLTAASFFRGVTIGTTNDGASLAGAVVGDLFVYGDVRDAVREGYRFARGEDGDALLLGLAGAGLAVTAGTYASAGTVAPIRAGLSAIKAGYRTGRIRPRLATALRVSAKDGLVRTTRDVGRVQVKAGTRGVFDALKVAESPRDLSRVARLAAARGDRTRAILKTAGRAAIVLPVAAFDLALWLFGALCTALGFCASIKRAVERVTIRSLWRRKELRARARLAAMTAQPSVAA